MSVAGALTLVALAAVAALLWFANRKGRPVRRWRLIIKPLGIAGGVAVAFASSPAPGAAGIALLAAVAAIGIGVGYFMAVRQALTLDSASGRITSRMSPAGFIVFVALFAGRFVLRGVLDGPHAPAQLIAHGAAIISYADAAMVFLLAAFAAQSWEIWRRSKVLSGPIRASAARG